MFSHRKRLAGAAGMLLFTLAAGTLGYSVLGEGLWSPFDCFYMTIITVTTVGFAEVLRGIDQVEGARTFTVVLLVFGTGTVVYFASTLTAMIVEGDLRKALRQKRMKKRIARMQDHIIVCGVGSTGRHTISELAIHNKSMVAIDTDEAVLESIAAELGDKHFRYIVGDATDDEVLERANLNEACGLVAALSADKDNLFVVVSARQANPNLRVISRGTSQHAIDKLRKAGADTVVSPNMIGGLRMASEMVRPTVVRFLDEMRRDQAHVRIEEIEIGEGSALDGQSVGSSRIHDDALTLVLAVELPGTAGYKYNPGAEFELGAGMTLVVLAPAGKLEQLRASAR